MYNCLIANLAGKNFSLSNLLRRTGKEEASRDACSELAKKGAVPRPRSFTEVKLGFTISFHPAEDRIGPAPRQCGAAVACHR